MRTTLINGKSKDAIGVTKKWSVKKIAYKREINKIFLLNTHTKLGMNALYDVHRLFNR